MTNDFIERAEEIFCTALEIESDEDRKTFVEEQCTGDSDLLRQVRHMLASFEDSTRLFDSIQPTSFSVVELTETLATRPGISENNGRRAADDGEVGKMIGMYRLLKKIGEGGGGSVYLAQQDKPVRRQVALKIIKLGMDTKSVIARFEAERQALAMMEHPNIAHVLNAGETEEGRPFFVMELVHGIPVTTYCEDNRLDIRARLELFMQICYAIQHAHQKGIIHRDIKPSNILIEKVEGLVVPKVIDFGIAKATGDELTVDHTEFTVFQPFIGTPAYMSPEQANLAEMDIDVRSDIYSLGVLLYELLAGKTPFDQKKLIQSGLEEMRRTIREREPARPSVKLAGLSSEEQAKTADNRRIHPPHLMSLLEGDLDWIVMKAMDKERDNRYQSAGGLAEDLQRYLDHEPVIARPPSRLYRMKKLVRRNKVMFASVTVVIVVLIINSSVSTWLLVKERVSRQRALQAEQEKGAIQQESENLAKALVLFRRGDMEAADALLDGIKHPSASPGNASMYRDIGDWHALHGRWEKARSRFGVLLRINEFEGTDSTMDDSRSAAVLAEQGYVDDYERFRESLVSRYAGTEDPIIAQRVLRECLLVPVKEELLHALNPYAKLTELSFQNANTDQSVKGWQAYALTLWYYRTGDFERCLEWCRLADSDLESSHFPTRALSVLFVQSAALSQLGQLEAARSDFDAAESGMIRFFNEEVSSSDVWMGFWFDQAYVRVHMREARALLESATSDPAE
ncbi:MAG: serine/threonine protein kinase [Pontiellaceae bacterium]|nr:serine/threonine protein kinase [Pontiellaceae bacterium]MBN2783676.1 serine/threonine protein kinase [Pontiellaceae bacterium]